MDSVPPARTMRDSPSAICCAAWTHGLEAGPAEPIHGERGCLDAATGAKAGMPREIDCVSRGLLRVADDHMIDVAGGDAAAD